MVKRFTAYMVLMCSAIMAYSQNAYDALRFSEQYIEGTARSVAMGNALVAVGGDMGGIQVNPASSAVYRYSEIVFTPSLTNASSSVNYLGSSASDNKTRAGISNFGFVGSYNTGRKNAGLVSWSVGLVLNKQNNFTGVMKAYGRTDASSRLASLAYGMSGLNCNNLGVSSNGNYDAFYNGNASWEEILAWNTFAVDTLPGTFDQYIAATENLSGNEIFTGGELEQKFRSKSTGNITEATINFGGNFANKLFVGINIGIQSILYKYEERYAEQAINSNDFQTGFNYYDAAYRYKATGSGINLKAGVIYIPADWVRLGASISTPTWMYLKEEWENNMYTSFADGFSNNMSSPLGTYEYRLNTPFRWNVGAAFKIRQLGLLSVDYESVNYSNAKLRDSDHEWGYDAENSDIRQLFTSQDIVRVGAEANVHPSVAVRAGYQYYSSAYKNGGSDDARHIGSFGIGYAIDCGSSNFFVDLTYQQLLKGVKESFSLYQDTDIAAPVGNSKTKNWKLLLSVGFRF